jgi:hypothetical protein
VLYFGFLSEQHPLPYKPQHAEIAGGILIEQFRRVSWKMKRLIKKKSGRLFAIWTPDEREKEKEVNTATIIATLALLIIVGGILVLLWLRVRQP